MNFKKIEQKWQKAWESKKAFKSKEGPGKPFYVLEMYPYPSGSGLHMGHAFNYTIGDIQARFRRMNGNNVLYPMGYDSFGLPAENAAIKAKSHPKKFTDEAIRNFIGQQKLLGLSYDWDRKVQSHDPNYYMWNQYFFLQFLKNGLAYRKKAAVNWCEKCKTVLANEQVHNGRCWRHKDTEVEIKHLEQWFFKTTKYADELLEKVDSLEWPSRIKAMQKNWIGKSFGTEIEFEINGEPWKIFTTRPDTIYGVTFMVVSAQHPRLKELVTKEQKKEVDAFLKKVKSTKQEDIDQLEKEGAFTGSYAGNPVNNEKVPVYAGNFVVADYGSGMVMAVPAHDQRDFEFAKKYGIDIKQVIAPSDNKKALEVDLRKRAYTGEGELVCSDGFNGINSKEAIDEITEFLADKKLGKKTTEFKLKDWLISRQRYWGTPIPVVYCDKCGVVPVDEKDLPVKLPEKVTFGKGNPLLSAKSWLETKCPHCHGKARRETDTMDTFVDSSWYYLRFCDNENKKAPFDKKKIDYWMPVNQYIGGAEHACMHLIYARFFTKALRDLKIIGKIDEPFTKLFNQGMLHGADGAVMSKSLGNVINPLEMIDKVGADALRFYLVSVSSPDSDSVWNDKGLESIGKFVGKVYDFFVKFKAGKSSKRLESRLNKTIRDVTNDIENFKYNLAVIKIRQLFDLIEQENSISKKDAESFLKLISVFCPHLAEEFWDKLGNRKFISLDKWPVADAKKIDEKLEQVDKAIDKTVGDVLNILKIVKDGKKVFLYVLPNEKEFYDAEELTKRIGKEVVVFAVNDPKKVDPEGKAKKAKPGRPGVYVE